MREFRYNDVARSFEEELEAEMLQHSKEKQAKKDGGGEERSALQRIAEDKSPLDEVRALIDSSRHKSAGEEIAEHRVRQKLAGIRDQERASIDTFITQAKNG